MWCPDVLDILHDGPTHASEERVLVDDVPGTSQADDEVTMKVATVTLPASTPIGKEKKFPPIYGMVRAVVPSKWNMCLRGSLYI